MSLEQSFKKRVRDIASAIGVGTAILTGNVNLSNGQSSDSVIVERLNKSLTQVQKETIKKVLGISVEEIEKDYDIEMQIDKGSNANYIIHIGQSHTVGLQNVLGPESSKGTIESQKKIFEFFLKMRQGGVNAKCIYTEGYTIFDNNTWETFRESYNSTKNLVKILKQQFINSEGKTYDPDFLEFFEKNLKFMGQIDNFHYYGEDIISFLELVKKFVDEKKIIVSSDFETKLGTIFKMKSDLVAKFGEPNELRQGAERLLYLKFGTPVICPAENLELNKNAKNLYVNQLLSPGPIEKEYLRLFKEYGNCLSKYNKLMEPLLDEEREDKFDKLDDLQKACDEECKPFFDKMLILKPLWKKETEEKEKRLAEQKKKHIYDAREEYAVSQIPRNETSFLIYGSGHNFTIAVESSNKSLPESQLGLIKITPKTK
jgi:hypothetical protein